MSEFVLRRRPLADQLQMILDKAQELHEKIVAEAHPAQGITPNQTLALQLVAMIAAIARPIRSMNQETTEYSWDVKPIREGGYPNILRWEVQFHRNRDDGSVPIHGGGQGKTVSEAIMRAAMAFANMERRYP